MDSLVLPRRPRTMPRRWRASGWFGFCERIWRHRDSASGNLPDWARAEADWRRGWGLEGGGIFSGLMSRVAYGKGQGNRMRPQNTKNAHPALRERVEPST